MKQNFKIIILVTFWGSLLIGCAKPQTANEQSITNTPVVQDSAKVPDYGSLAYLLRDSLANIDPQMTHLLDSIYQHDWPIYTEFNEYSTIGKEMGWVNERKTALLQAYQMESANDTAQLRFILDYIDRACEIWDVFQMTGSMRDHVNAGIGSQLATYQTYLCLQHIYSAYDEGSIIHLMSREFCSLEIFTDALRDYVREVVYLQYFHGSMAGYLTSVLSYDIEKAKYNLYKNEVLNPYLCVPNDDNSSVADGIELLRQTCNAALLDLGSEKNIHFYEEEGMPELADEYKASLQKASEKMDILFQRIDERGFFAYRKERTELWDSHRNFKQANDARLIALLAELTDIVNAAR